MNVFWRCEPRFTTMFLKALSTPTFIEISRLRGLTGAQALNSKLTENIRDMRKMCNSMAQFPAQLPPLQALSDLVNTLDGERADLLSAQAFIRSAARSLESSGDEAALPGWLACVGPPSGVNT